MKVLDSDIVIASLRGITDAVDAVDAIKALEQRDELAIATPTQYEVLLGAYFYGKKTQLDKTEEFFDRYNMLPLDRSAAKKAASIHAGLMRKGHDVEDMDVLIAATAINDDASVVTRNKEHFRRIEDLRVEQW
jgi:predicted nucleic acid-binding protein